MPGLINTRMEWRLAQGFIGGPEWSTRIVSLANGSEVRNKGWTYPRHRYTASVGAFSERDREALRTMFYVTAGQWAAFRFKDPIDHQANAEQFATVSGTMTPVQLVKNYEFGGETCVRRIQGPVASTVSVMSGATPIPGTVDETTGMFTPSINWPAVFATWSGMFDVWVRFTSDYGAFTAVTPNVLTADIELTEVRTT